MIKKMFLFLLLPISIVGSHFEVKIKLENTVKHLNNKEQAPYCCIEQIKFNETIENDKYRIDDNKYEKLKFIGKSVKSSDGPRHVFRDEKNGDIYVIFKKDQIKIKKNEKKYFIELDEYSEKIVYRLSNGDFLIQQRNNEDEDVKLHGYILFRQENNTFEDLDLLAIGSSFVGELKNGNLVFNSWGNILYNGKEPEFFPSSKCVIKIYKNDNKPLKCINTICSQNGNVLQAIDGTIAIFDNEQINIYKQTNKIEKSQNKTPEVTQVDTKSKNQSNIQEIEIEKKEVEEKTTKSSELNSNKSNGMFSKMSSWVKEHPYLTGMAAALIYIIFNNKNKISSLAFVNK